MAENIKVQVLSERDDIVAIADAVRNKTGSTDEMTLSEIVTGINSITGTGSGTDTSDATAIANEIFKNKTAYVANGKVTGTFTIDDELMEQNDLISQILILVATKATPPSTDTNDATASAGDILSGKTAYVKGKKITGTIATVTQATPSIEVSSSGLITATATQSEGYINTGTKSGTKQLTTKTTTTYTPTTSNQTIPSGTYLTGNQTIVGDANLIAENIKNGISIFGVAGSYEGSGSSGGTIETVNITLVNTNMYDDYFVYGTWVDGNYITSYPTDVYCDDSKEKTALKGSYIILTSTIVKSITGTYTQDNTLGAARFFAVTGDCTITLK